MGTVPLTANQERVWRYIASCERSPTFTEMQRDLGYSSRGQLHGIIGALKERGFVAHKPFRTRSIVALDPQIDLTGVPTSALVKELSRRRLVR